MGRRRTFDPSAVRTLAFAGHRSAGKTSLAEALLQSAGAIRSLGSVDRRTALLDHHDEERRRKLSLQNSYAWLEWGGALVHLVDTPGSAVVGHLRDLAVSCVDGVVLVIDATAGVQVGTEDVLAGTEGKPMVCVFNKADRRRSLEAVVEAVESAAGRRVLPLQLPFRDDDDRFVGVVSLQTMSVYRYASDGSGSFSVEPVPDRYRSAAAAAWERVVEAVALTDDALLEKYLEYMELDTTEVMEALTVAVRQGALIPAVFTAATTAVGVEALLDMIVGQLPAPLVPQEPDFVAQVVSTHLDPEGQLYRVLRVWGGKPPRSGQLYNASTRSRNRVRRFYQIRGPRRAVATTTCAGCLLATWDDIDARPGDTLTDGVSLALPSPEPKPPMMAYVVTAKDSASARALPQALQSLMHIDTGLRLHTDEVGNILLAGRDDGHLSLAVKRLEDLWSVSVVTALPHVKYIETPMADVSDVAGIHVLEDSHGLVEEYGACRLDLSPLPPDQGVRFVDRVSDEEALPARWRPAIERGAQEALAHGPTAGYPVVGADVRLRGGEYDILQSTDDHFVAAGRNALRNALSRSGTRLLEPWWTLQAWIPAECVGDLLADVSSHRGRILGVESGAGVAGSHVRALCPHRELRTFAGRLQRLTGGRGTFSTAPSHYEALPAHLVPEAIADSPFRNERLRQAVPEMPNPRRSGAA